MYLAADYIHPTPHKGRCRVRIYRPDLHKTDNTHRTYYGPSFVLGPPDRGYGA